jgi:hypothetical protein
LLRAAYAAGDNIRRLAETLGRHHTSLRWKAKELGLQGSHPKPDGNRMGPPWTSGEDAQLRAGYGKIKTSLLAHQIGRPKGAVFNRARSLGLVHGYHRPFTADEIKAVEIASRHGITASQLGRAMGRAAKVFEKRCAIQGVTLARGKGGYGNRGRDWTLAEILALENPPATTPNVTPRRVRQLADALGVRPRKVSRAVTKTRLKPRMVRRALSLGGAA